MSLADLLQQLREIKATLEPNQQIRVNDGCEECSSVWQRELTLHGVSEAVEKLDKILKECS